MDKRQIMGFTHTLNGIASEIITDCGVSLPYNPNSNLKHPQIVKTKGLWDTGASSSVITKKLAKDLNLVPIGSAESHHAGGTSIVNIYLINLYLPNNVALQYIRVTECDETIGRFGVLIGMDVFSMGDFALSHFSGMTTVSFRMPTIQKIDLSKDCLPINKPNQTKANSISRNDMCPCNSGKKYKHCHGK